MVTWKPRIVIIGAGMAGLTAANKLWTSGQAGMTFDLTVLEGGSTIGGRICSSDFCGDRIEQGATWIHGVEGSPVYKLAQEIGALQSQQPWECMDGLLEPPVNVAEGGHELDPSFVKPISSLFENLMDFVQGKAGGAALDQCGATSVGAFLRRGLDAYLESESKGGVNGVGKWSTKSLQEAIFAMHESTQRIYTSADDLFDLDYAAEKEYILFPGKEITIARGYSSVIESLASVLPPGTIQLGRKVEKIEWQSDGTKSHGGEIPPVKLHFNDGSALAADHVIITVSLGILKQGIRDYSGGLFSPPLPSSKIGAISRLGYGVVDKVFLHQEDEGESKGTNFPFLQMVFHPPDSEMRNPNIPNWIRRTSSLSPIHGNTRVLVSWFTGEEALKLESLSDEEIINGFSNTVSDLLPSGKPKLDKVLRTKWGTNPLFLGSYSYIAVGSSIDDMDTLAEPLPEENSSAVPPLQILFAGEATHRTHYSTTHGAYFSGLREANRLLHHYYSDVNAGGSKLKT